MTAAAWRLIAVHFVLLAVGVQLMARAVDSTDPSAARRVFLCLLGLGAGIGWVLRGAWDRRHE